jgi:RNA polymerase sigma-70 factor (ECF subfamily)
VWQAARSPTAWVAKTLLAILKLPEFQREIVTMYHVLNMSYDEIGEITGTPIGTVKSRLNRARLALRDLLKRDLDAF